MKIKYIGVLIFLFVVLAQGQMGEGDDSDLPCAHYGDQGGDANKLKNKGCCIVKNGKCQFCTFGMGLVRGDCKVCKVKDCAACDGDVDACQQYAPQSRVDNCSASENYRCVKCSPGYRMSIDQTQCQKCLVDACAACWNSLGTCEKCHPFFRMDKNGSCKRCSDPNCVSCDENEDVCTKCFDAESYYDPAELPSKNSPKKNDAYGLQKGTCVKCGEGELACGDGKAPKCMYGYILNNKKTKCSKVKDTGSPKPPKEIPNCVAYSTDSYDFGACIQCKDGYGGYKDDKKCSKCRENCFTCEDSTKICDMCINGYGRTRDGVCKKCPEHSTDCYDNGSGRIVQCEPGYVADDESWSCNKCEDSMCKQCTSPSQCIVCGEKVSGRDNVAFYSPDNASGDCVECPQNMQYCTNGRYICEPGYALSGTTCKRE